MCLTQVGVLCVLSELVSYQPQACYVTYCGQTPTRISLAGQKMTEEYPSPSDPMWCPDFCRNMIWTSFAGLIRYATNYILSVVLINELGRGRWL